MCVCVSECLYACIPLSLQCVFACSVLFSYEGVAQFVYCSNDGISILLISDIYLGKVLIYVTVDMSTHSRLPVGYYPQLAVWQHVQLLRFPRRGNHI